MKVRPLGDRILIQLEDAVYKTNSGLFLTKEQETGRDTKGTVISKGTGEFADDVQIGDKLIFSKYSGTEVQHNGKECMIILGKDMIAVIEEE